MNQTFPKGSIVALTESLTMPGGRLLLPVGYQCRVVGVVRSPGGVTYAVRTQDGVTLHLLERMVELVVVEPKAKRPKHRTVKQLVKAGVVRKGCGSNGIGDPSGDAQSPETLVGVVHRRKGPSPPGRYGGNS